MAQMDTGGGDDHGKKKGKKRAKKSSTAIDMTPMVDLAFLLLTFFMLTTTFSKPQAMQINMPVKPENEDDQQKVAESTALTIILSDKDKIFYYFGIKDPQVETTDFGPEGIRKLLLDRNKKTIAGVEKIKADFAPKIKAAATSQEREDLTKQMKSEANKVKSEKDALMVLIKTDEKAKYKNVVDMLDEMAICTIGKYALVDISPAEKTLIEGLTK